MPSLRSLAAFAALFAAAVASPVDLERLEKRKTFSIHQTPRGQVLKHGARSMQKTYLKYNVPVPDHIAAAAAAAGSVTGSAAANPGSYDQEYLTPVTVGGNTLNLDFDTGSADLWVFSTLLPTGQQSGHSNYDPSSGTLESGYSWKISYGDGSGASGKVYADKVVVGGVTATSQAVEAATSISSQFQQDVNDGLLGLAFSSINTVSPQPQTTFFDTVKSSLASPLFAVTLKKGAPGTYDFGYIDDSKYTESLAYVDVDTSNGFWQFTTSGYSVGSGSTVSGSFSGIADTGTTLLYLPSSVVSAYYSKVSGAKNSRSAGGWVFPCSATLPSFTAVIGGQERTVPGSYINYAPVSGSTCFGGIQPNTGIGFSIFGDIFLKSQYVVFDASVPQLGFAQQA